MSKHIKLNKDIVKGIKQILWANYKELPEKKCKMYEIAQALHMHENKLSLINTGRLYPEVPWPTGTQGSFNDAIIEESETKYGYTPTDYVHSTWYKKNILEKEESTRADRLVQKFMHGIGEEGKINPMQMPEDLRNDFLDWQFERAQKEKDPHMRKIAEDLLKDSSDD